MAYESIVVWKMKKEAIGDFLYNLKKDFLSFLKIKKEIRLKQSLIFRLTAKL